MSIAPRVLNCLVVDDALAPWATPGKAAAQLTVFKLLVNDSHPMLNAVQNQLELDLRHH